jgi:hypothetical protein
MWIHEILYIEPVKNQQTKYHDQQINYYSDMKL